jgi:hypothetical protein
MAGPPKIGTSKFQVTLQPIACCNDEDKGEMELHSYRASKKQRTYAQRHRHAHHTAPTRCHSPLVDGIEILV